jgi:hypothetical protein
MLADLPTACDVDCKKNGKGDKETWVLCKKLLCKRPWPQAVRRRIAAVIEKSNQVS